MVTMGNLILVVEDEADLATTLEYNLKREGYSVRSARNGRDALVAATQEPLPDLVLLDLMLPDISGIDVCRQLRKLSSTRELPIIMVTAMADEVDRVVGFELGADDYVTKPYSNRELMLRIKAVLRRRQRDVEEEFVREVFGCLEIESDAHSVWVGGEQVEMTALEFRLLIALFESRGRVRSRDQLLEEVWGHSPDMETRTVDTHVKRLRQKLAAAGNYIETVRGVGYRFCRQPDEGPQ